MFAAMPFFIIFGSTLFMALFIAFAYTMIFLPPLLMLFGPDHHPQGDLYALLAGCYSKPDNQPSEVRPEGSVQSEGKVQSV